jgi:hypothetical protein
MGHRLRFRHVADIYASVILIKLGTAQQQPVNLDISGREGVVERPEKK